MAFDLDSMNDTELQQIRQQLETVMTKRKREQLATAYRQISEIAKNHNTTLEELIAYGQKKGKKSGSTGQITPKYRHPDDAELTWSGRGKKPRWVQEHLDNGQNLDDLLIK